MPSVLRPANISAVLWAWLLPRRGRSGRRLDFNGKHHASSSKMSAAWWQLYQEESASKTNFLACQKPANHKITLLRRKILRLYNASNSPPCGRPFPNYEPLARRSQFNECILHKDLIQCRCATMAYCHFCMIEQALCFDDSKHRACVSPL